MDQNFINLKLIAMPTNINYDFYFYYFVCKGVGFQGPQFMQHLFLQQLYLQCFCIVLHHCQHIQIFANNLKSYINIDQDWMMEVTQQVDTYVTYGQKINSQPDNPNNLTKQTTFQSLKVTKQKFIQTKSDYAEFRKNFKKTVSDILHQSVNQIVVRAQKMVGVKNDYKTLKDFKQFRRRFREIIKTIYKQHIMKSRIMNTPQMKALLKTAKFYSIKYIVPIYINLRAVMLVTREMFVEFIDNLLNGMKLTYETSREHVIMFVAGKFNEQKLKTKIFEGIVTFKNFTVRFLNKGLEIKIDKQSLLQNYDKFAINFLQMIKDIKQTGQQNIHHAKKKSKNLYKEVMSRIRSKKIQIRADLLQTMPQLIIPTISKK